MPTLLYCRNRLLSVLLLMLRSAGLRMPLAQAHPFEPMPVTHEEDMQEVGDTGGRRDAAARPGMP